jgi:transcriptional regulator EpsA
MSTDKLLSVLTNMAPMNSVRRLATEEQERFLRLVLDELAIQRHYHLFLWLRGEFQDLLPHEILLSASGNFADWLLKLDVVSKLPEVRTRQLAQHNIDSFIELAHTRWVRGERRPLVLDPKEAHDSLGDAPSVLHDALRRMQSTLVHGVHDFREGFDSIYIVQSGSPMADPDVVERRLFMLDLLTPQVDLAFRRIVSLPLALSHGKISAGKSDKLNLSTREQEILDLICRGETNSNIAAALEISPFTVKNHLQRIFKKIGVSNRTQAATRYNEALRELRKFLT